MRITTINGTRFPARIHRDSVSAGGAFSARAPPRTCKFGRPSSTSCCCCSSTAAAAAEVVVPSSRCSMTAAAAAAPRRNHRIPWRMSWRRVRMIRRRAAALIRVHVDGGWVRVRGCAPAGIVATRRRRLRCHRQSESLPTGYGGGVVVGFRRGGVIQFPGLGCADSHRPHADSLSNHV